MKQFLTSILSAILLASCASTTVTNGVDVCPVQGNNLPKALRTHMCIETPQENKGINIPGVNFLWNYKSRKWQKDELTVCFLNGTDKQKARVKQYAVEWEQYCAIKLIWLDVIDPKADIRVSFTCGGHWSYIGKYNSNVDDGKATMNIELGSFEVSDEWRRVVLHEFGHALGLEHEQQHPERKLQMDEEKVYQVYMTTQGWSRQQVYEQVIKKANPKPEEWEGTDWDKDSIMHYEFPPELTKDGRGVGWNTKLSQKDKEHIGKMYPKE